MYLRGRPNKALQRTVEPAAELGVGQRQQFAHTIGAGEGMRNEFTAIIEQAEGWFIAYSPEVPGANGQGRTRGDARASLAEAIKLILQDRREDALRGLPPEAERATVTIE